MTDATRLRSPSSYSIRRHDALEEVGRDAWDGLASRSPGATIFQTWMWNRAWWEQRRDGGHSLVLLSVWRSGRLVALAPFHLGAVQPGRGRALSFLGHGNSDYLDILVDPDELGALDAVLEAVAGLKDPWERCVLAEIREASPLRRRLSRLQATDQLRLVRDPDTRCPRFAIDLERAAFSKLPEKASLRRHASRLARLGPVSVDHLREPAEILALLPSFFRQHVERWSVTSTPSLFLDPRSRAFYEEVAREGARTGEVLLTVVRVAGRPVAFHFGFVRRGSFVWYKPSFDIRLFREAPGEVLLQASLRFAAAEGLREFDFTRGDEAYKSRFSNDVRANANVTWYRSAGAAHRGAAHREVSRLIGRMVARSRPHPLFGGYVESFVHDWRTGPGSLPATAAALVRLVRTSIRSLFRMERFAVCDPVQIAPPENVRLDGLGPFLDADSLEPGSPDVRLAADAFRRLRSGQACLVLESHGRARAAAWLEGSTGLDRVVGIAHRLEDSDRRILARAATGAMVRAGMRPVIRLGDGLDLDALRREGLSPRGLRLETKWFRATWTLSHREPVA